MCIQTDRIEEPRAQPGAESRWRRAADPRTIGATTDAAEARSW